MEKMWKKEVARDLLALGSWVFYILVIGRALIKPYRPFADQIIIAGLIVIILGLVFRRFDFDDYVSRGLVLIFFTSIFYETLVYTLFASAVGLLLVFSSYFIKRDAKRIVIGFIIGGLAIFAGHYGALASAKLF